MEDKNNEKVKTTGSGIAVGIGLGVAFGVALNNIGLWLAVGVALGAAWDSQNKAKKK